MQTTRQFALKLGILYLIEQQRVVRLIDGESTPAFRTFQLFHTQNRIFVAKLQKINHIRKHARIFCELFCVYQKKVVPLHAYLIENNGKKS